MSKFWSWWFKENKREYNTLIPKKRACKIAEEVVEDKRIQSVQDFIIEFKKRIEKD